MSYEPTSGTTPKSGAATTTLAPEAPTEDIKEVYSTLNSNLTFLYKALPPATAFILFTGHSDPRKMSDLSKRKNRWDQLLREGTLVVPSLRGYVNKPDCAQATNPNRSLERSGGLPKQVGSSRMRWKWPSVVCSLSGLSMREARKKLESVLLYRVYRASVSFLCM